MAEVQVPPFTVILITTATTIIIIIIINSAQPETATASFQPNNEPRASILRQTDDWNLRQTGSSNVQVDVSRAGWVGRRESGD